MEIVELINNLKAGKYTAQEHLFGKYRDKIHRWICVNFIAGRAGRTKDQAHDILANTFIAIYKDIAGFRSNNEISLLAWMYKITYNIACAYFSTKRKLVYVSCDDTLESETIEIPDSKIIGDGFITGQEKTSYIITYLMRLNKNQRKVILLYAVEDLSNKEIAEILFKSEDAVKKIKRRALSKLKNLMSSDEYFSDYINERGLINANKI